MLIQSYQLCSSSSANSLETRATMGIDNGVNT